MVILIILGILAVIFSGYAKAKYEILFDFSAGGRKPKFMTLANEFKINPRFSWVQKYKYELLTHAVWRDLLNTYDVYKFNSEINPNKLWYVYITSDDNGKYKEAFPFSTTLLVMFTDLRHRLNFYSTIGLTISVACITIAFANILPLYLLLIVSILGCKIVHQTVFHIFYNRLR